MKLAKSHSIRLFIATVCILTLVSGCRQSQKTNKDSPQIITHQNIAHKKTREKPLLFAPFNLEESAIKPSVERYKIAPHLSNVTNAKKLTLSPEATKKLETFGFVVDTTSPYQEFDELYSSINSADIPLFVTVDALLHLYHLIFDQLLQQLEINKFLPALTTLCNKLLTQSLQTYTESSEEPLKQAALRATALCAVPVKLLGENPILPDEIKSLVDAELALINAHAGIAESPIMNLGKKSSGFLPAYLNAAKEDYTQYIPRGHYTRSEELKKYFKAMMWIGRITFRFWNDSETQSALLLSRAFMDDETKKLWSSIYETTAFLVGPSDDITIPALLPIAKEIYGESIDLKKVASDSLLTTFSEKLKKLPPPRINSMIVIEGQDTQKAAEGARLMGQRFVLDASIFQQLMAPKVKLPEPLPGGRNLPRALDIPAALKSDESVALLREMGEMENYPAYEETLQKVQKNIAALTPEEWIQTIASGWLYLIKPLLEPRENGWPFFMQNQAWTRKQLQSFMGSWAELKHDTILYAKQPYGEMALCPMPGPKKEKPDTRGYIEPQPAVYSRLAALAAMTQAGLDSHNLLSDNFRSILTDMAKLAKDCQAISEKELTNTPLSEQDYDLIHYFGGTLTSFINRINLEKDARAYTETEPAALIADVATDPNGTILEVGIGAINKIYVIAPVAGSLRITCGGVYSYYEFAHPMADRLTDEKWREMLKKETPPMRVQWTNMFTA